jgi:hypothetical protein
MSIGMNPSEQAMSLREAAKWIASHTGAPVPNQTTVNRWVVHGVRGVRLQAKRVGAKFWTTSMDLAEFLDALNSDKHQQQISNVAHRSNTFEQAARREQIEAACAKIDNLCTGFK